MIVSRDGWVKRQKEVKDISTTRLREGDAVLAIAQGSTRATVVFFSNFGAAYTVRIADVPASTGYGEPIQRLFKLKDGERIVAAFSLDPRVAGAIAAKKEGAEPPVHAVAVTSDGYSLRFSFEPFVEPSTRAGRRYARAPEGAEVVGVARLTGGEILIAATREARAMLTKAVEVNLPLRPRTRRHPDQAGQGRSRPRVHRVLGRSRPDDRRNDAAARSRRSAPRSTKSPAAAARGASSSSAASSRKSCPSRPRRPRPCLKFWLALTRPPSRTGVRAVTHPVDEDLRSLLIDCTAASGSPWYGALTLFTPAG